MTIPSIWWLAPASAVLSLLVAFSFYKKLIAESEGTDRMQEIAGYVKEGAKAYLTRQYKAVFKVFAVIFVLLGVMAYLGIQSPFVPFIFLSGVFLSISSYFEYSANNLLCE